MSYESRRSPRTYTYRIPLDDDGALRKMRMFQKLHDDYLIAKVHKNDVSTSRMAQHWACVFYESREQFDYDRDGMIGGAIPGMGEYRYSLDWRPAPVHGNVEMKRGSDGGTRLKGTRHVGLSDPRLPNDVPIDVTVAWTPSEIERMHDGEPVPDRENYHRDPPMVPASDALEDLRETLRWAERDGIETLEARLQETIENCDHDHVVVRDDPISRNDVAYCEDCGRSFTDSELTEMQNHGDLRVVGTT